MLLLADEGSKEMEPQATGIYLEKVWLRLEVEVLLRLALANLSHNFCCFSQVQLLGYQTSLISLEDYALAFLHF